MVFLEVGWDQVPGLTARQIQTLEQGMALRTRDRLQSVKELMEGLMESGDRMPPKAPPWPPKKGWLLAVILAAAAALGGLSLMKDKAPQQVEARLPETTQQTLPPRQTEAAQTLPAQTLAAEAVQEPQQWKENVLMPAKADMAAVAGWNDKPMLGSRYLRRQISSVTFLDSTEDMGENAWDVSQNGDGSVWAWAEEEGRYYALYIAADGGVAAPGSCKELFARMTNLERISFNGCFHTENTVTMDSMFAFDNALQELDLSGLDTSGVWDMGAMLQDCANLQAVNLSGLNTAQVRDMSNLFAGCASLTQLDVTGFDTSAVHNMSSMFGGCTGLTELDLSGFDTANVKLMTEMFRRWKTVNRLKLGSWETDSIREEWHFGHFMEDGIYFGGKRWENLFYDVMNKTQTQPWEANVLMSDSVEWKPGVGMDVLGSKYDRSEIKSVTFLDTTAGKGENAWDVSQNGDGSVWAWVDENNGLFIAGEGGVMAPDYCKNLFSNYGAESISFNGCFHTNKVTDMSQMFRDCQRLKSLDLSGWETGGVENMDSLFHGCVLLESIDLSGWDTFWVSDMTGMFRRCESLKSLDLTHLDTSRVTKMREMFTDCASLVGLDLSRLDTSMVTDMGQMFAGCGELEGLKLGPWDTGSVEKDWGYWNFMDPGVNYNGSAWEELFCF